jgi:hypothetical protein
MPVWKFFLTGLFTLGAFNTKILTKLTLPVVYMTQDVMILMRANLFRGPLKEVGPENRDIFGP